MILVSASGSGCHVKLYHAWQRPSIWTQEQYPDAAIDGLSGLQQSDGSFH